jgi:hypothetical protein
MAMMERFTDVNVVAKNFWDLVDNEGQATLDQVRLVHVLQTGASTPVELAQQVFGDRMVRWYMGNPEEIGEYMKKFADAYNAEAARRGFQPEEEPEAEEPAAPEASPPAAPVVQVVPAPVPVPAVAPVVEQPKAKQKKAAHPPAPAA